jgi:hypothetical protein
MTIVPCAVIRGAEERMEMRSPMIAIPSPSSQQFILKYMKHPPKPWLRDLHLFFGPYNGDVSYELGMLVKIFTFVLTWDSAE